LLRGGRVPSLSTRKGGSRSKESWDRNQWGKKKREKAVHLLGRRQELHVVEDLSPSEEGKGTALPPEKSEWARQNPSPLRGEGGGGHRYDETKGGIDDGESPRSIAKGRGKKKGRRPSEKARMNEMKEPSRPWGGKKRGHSASGGKREKKGKEAAARHGPRCAKGKKGGNLP